MQTNGDNQTDSREKNLALKELELTWIGIRENNVNQARESLFRACIHSLSADSDELDKQLLEAEGACSALEAGLLGNEAEQKELKASLEKFRSSISKPEEERTHAAEVDLSEGENLLRFGRIKEAKARLLSALLILELTPKEKNHGLRGRLAKATGKLLALQAIFFSLKRDRSKTLAYAEGLKKKTAKKP